MVDAAQRDLRTVDENAPGVGPVEAADDFDERGLAGAVVPEQAEHLAPLDVQVHLAQRGQGAEPFGDALDPQRVGACAAGCRIIH